VISALPRVAPLTLKRRAQAFDNSDWLLELKYDGFRALLEVDGTGARLVSRNRSRFKHLDPRATALAKRLRVNDAILDGEVICVDETGRPIFMDLLRRREPVCFIAFDLLWLNGADLRTLALTERKARLRRLLRRRSNHLIAEAMAIDGRGKAMMAAVLEYDLEGIVAKRKGDPYRRGVHWWKIKNPAYSQADDGRGERLNGDGRSVRVKIPRGTVDLRRCLESDGQCSHRRARQPDAIPRGSPREAHLMLRIPGMCLAPLLHGSPPQREI
jgi:ATP-dependent DNA ligase